MNAVVTRGLPCIPAVAYHICLNLPEKFSQPGISDIDNTVATGEKALLSEMALGLVIKKKYAITFYKF